MPKKTLIPTREVTNITLVDLPNQQSVKESFLKHLQTALAKAGLLNVLPTVPGSDYITGQTFFIPTNVEADVRKKLGLSYSLADDETWTKQLQKWGATNVRSLDRDSYFALLNHREKKDEKTSSGPPFTKLSVTEDNSTAKKTVSGFGVLPKDFKPNNDWHLGPHGANVFAAWKLFKKSDKLPWKNIRIGHIDTGYTKHAALGWTGDTSTHMLVKEGQDYWRNGDRWEWGKNPGVHHDPYDDGSGPARGHGTRISATMAGYLEGASFAGVAPGVCIVPYRVTDSVIVDHVKDLIAQLFMMPSTKAAKSLTFRWGFCFPAATWLRH